LNRRSIVEEIAVVEHSSNRNKKKFCVIVCPQITATLPVEMKSSRRPSTDDEFRCFRSTTFFSVHHVTVGLIKSTCRLRGICWQ